MGSVDLVFVGKPKEPGKSAQLLVAVGGRLQRVAFNPGPVVGEAQAPAQEGKR